MQASLSNRQNSLPSDILPPPFPTDIEMTHAVVEEFREIIYGYYGLHGRSFPWRTTSDPYKILLSELMLQQTQVSRVLPKYQAFLEYWPTLSDLSKGSLTDILSLWRGLGYNRRALALKKIADISVERYEGTLPESQKELLSLPMVGPATSAALLAFAYGKPSLYLETNIRRVLIYFFYHERERVHDKDLYTLLDLVLDRENPKEWYYAFMDYGVYLKELVPNPNRRSAHYTRQTKFENSNRQIRGELLTIFTERGAVSRDDILRILTFSSDRIDTCLDALVKEGFIVIDSPKGRDDMGGFAAEESPVYKIT